LTDSDGRGRTRALLRAIVAQAESDRERGQPTLRRGIFLLPNLITSGALFAGFYAMVAAMNGDFVPAAVATYAAMILDVLDGRVARLTRTQSAFGAEYDSLSDMVAFGVAPALVAFNWALVQLNQVGWLVTFLYMACAALRLARYNTSGDIRSFTGLASPAAACVVVSAVWVLELARLPGEPVDFPSAAVLAVVTTAMALLMVSHFRYYSPKVLTFRGRVPFMVLVGAVALLALVFADPPRTMLVLFSLYALSGPVQWLWRLRGADAAEPPPRDGD
jgi:CDP-diacylglycerol--serine O-phosphatidyltransferase